MITRKRLIQRYVEAASKAKNELIAFRSMPDPRDTDVEKLTNAQIESKARIFEQLLIV
jgi:hypothetical protein